ncbi:hypothetical protein ERJ75_000236100 [Trypanosoma vivax]|uniref:Uncharacterized protein n=1 Tax=Trypanosoma vivax (strain Y486) TaxID=1055687 RepID=F9WV20_TRYVY|nr:hypothetical protein TRVL_05102 [Trypanosoma vivax]KAH8618705.1 hypothetical protein ERJ75_000236100 [Trypanosoma vivax]CCD21421.1 hypothetical protein, conserved [Trypanosoma vivax Y486]|eukprot:CCD21421.1 hypothetical protein, conserved [Trypanosoma vivax Y486]
MTENYVVGTEKNKSCTTNGVSRKRYRPLDTTEERSVGVIQALNVSLLQDEQSYCFRWPEAPLTTMLRVSNTSLTLGTQGTQNSCLMTNVVQPPVYEVSVMAAEHKNVQLFTSFSPSSPAIRLYTVNTQVVTPNTVVKRNRRPPTAPPTTSADDSVFSFSVSQMVDLEASGAFRVFYAAHYPSLLHSASCSVDLSFVSLARRRMEEEIVDLEWRALQASEKMSPTLQQMLLLHTAVPFWEMRTTGEEADESDKKWQRIVYDLWIKWRVGAPANKSKKCRTNGPAWGSPLMPGSFIPSLSKEYFVNVVSERIAGIKVTRNHDGMEGGADKSKLMPLATRRRGAYGYLRWRIDLYEPKLRLMTNEEDKEYETCGSTRLLTASEVSKLIEEKLPPLLRDVRVDARIDPLDAFSLTDIRGAVSAWKRWLNHV